MITGKTATRRQRFQQGLLGTLLLLAVFLPLLLTGRLDRVEQSGLDWLQRNVPETSHLRDDIVIAYIDQKSIDFFLQSRNIGWPWPRDAYALVVQYLQAAGARAVIFDATFSEPSVFASDYNDDLSFASAMNDYGRVFQTLLLHKELKGGAPVDEQRLNDLLERSIDFERRWGPEPLENQDVTMPIKPLMDAAMGLGIINITPEADGVVRRLRPVEALRDRVFATLSLEVYLKITGTGRLVQDKQGIHAGGIRIPIDRDGMTLVKYYGGLNTYRDYTIAALMQAGMDIMAGKTPQLPTAEFQDKIVFIGAKASALYDLRSTPVDDALPGVTIHATFLNNILENDFLRRTGPVYRGLAAAALAIGTLAAAMLAGSVTGAAISLALAALYFGLTVLLFRHNLWIDLATPVGLQVAVFILAALINYYGEGKEKKQVRNAFSLYLSPQVVEDVLANPQMLSLGGSRRIMTCFFSDLAGFTSISESLSPEELVHLLNRYLSQMTDIIMKWGGTVDKFEGDAIMAFWGAPLIQEDHAHRACMAALEQQRAMEDFRKKAKDDGLPELRVRMGINTGPMIVGNMGSQSRFNYTVMGDAVNLASRLEGANKAYGTYIMISEAAYEEVRDRVEVRELDLLRVKGKKEPIKVYELMAESGRLPKEQTEIITEYNRGLDQYRRMEFGEAEKTFANILRQHPGDGPSETYRNRCRAYLESPPPPDWDRVFTLTTK